MSDRKAQQALQEAERKKAAKSTKEAMIERLKKQRQAMMESDIEIYQNDRTIAPDPRMYEQKDQELRYEAPIEKMNGGGMCRGSKAIRGKKFTGVF